MTTCKSAIKTLTRTKKQRNEDVPKMMFCNKNYQFSVHVVNKVGSLAKKCMDESTHKQTKRVLFHEIARNRSP